MDAITDVLLAVFGNFFLIIFTAIAISCKRNGKRHHWIWYTVGAVQQVINVVLITTSRLTGYPPPVHALAWGNTPADLTTIPLLFAVVSAGLIVAGAVAVRLVKRKEKT